MAQLTFELDLSSLAHPNAANRKLFAFQSRDKALVRAVYANGAAAGPQVVVEVPAAKLVETHGHGSSPKIAPVPAHAPVTLEAGNGATHAQILFKGKYSFVQLPAGKQTAWPLPELRTVHSSSDSQWKLVVIAELFRPGSEEKFFAYAGDLAQHLLANPPFNKAEVAKRIQVDGYFVPSPPEGLFESKPLGKNDRRIYGEYTLVQQFINARGIKLRKNDMVLVLMNIAQRGGAGERDDENIAWATPYVELDPAVGPEDWRDIALHEIGHAFELDDEYETGGVTGLTVVQANVTTDPAHAPWAALLTADRPPDLRSDHRPMPGDTWPENWSRDWATEAEISKYSGVVGMFEGARYNTYGYWRSSLLCKMRLTRDKFCPQCQAIIEKAILSNG